VGATRKMRDKCEVIAIIEVYRRVQISQWVPSVKYWLLTSVPLYPKTLTRSFTHHTSRSDVIAMRERCVKIVCRSWSRELFSTRSPRTVSTRSVRRESHRFLWQTSNYRHTSPSSHTNTFAKARDLGRSWNVRSKVFSWSALELVPFTTDRTKSLSGSHSSRSIVMTQVTTWTNSLLSRYLKSFQFWISKNHE